MPIPLPVAHQSHFTVREMNSKLRNTVALLTVLSICLGFVWTLENRAKDNGDIYIINYDSFDGDVDDISTTTEAPRSADYIDFDEISRQCNASFITPLCESWQDWMSSITIKNSSILL